MTLRVARSDLVAPESQIALSLSSITCDLWLFLDLNNVQTQVKCYMGDAGLLSMMAFSVPEECLSEAYRQVFLGDSGVNEGNDARWSAAQQWLYTTCSP